MNNTNKVGARHGDISFHPLQRLPKGLKEIGHNGSFVLAKGEYTGHAHKLVSQGVRIFQDQEGRYVLEVKDKAEIVHEEHGAITLLPGIYQQEQERERDPFLDQIRQVAD